MPFLEKKIPRQIYNEDATYQIKYFFQISKGYINISDTFQIVSCQIPINKTLRPRRHEQPFDQFDVKLFRRMDGHKYKPRYLKI